MSGCYTVQRSGLRSWGKLFSKDPKDSIMQEEHSTSTEKPTGKVHSGHVHTHVSA